MRICLYTGSALPKLGGQEAVVDALARHLQRLGHEPTVLAPRPRPRLPLRPRDGDLPYPVIRHPRFYSTHHLVGWYRTFLLRAHRRTPFDVIHCHDAYPTGYVAALCKPTTGVPLVITSHGGDVRAGNARLSKPGLRPRFLRAVAAADALVCIGRFTREAFAQLGATELQMVDIPNGVDPVAVVARPADLDAAILPGRYLLFLGRLAHRKGVDTLLKALSLLPPAGGVELVIAGSGDLGPAIERDVRERQLEGRVSLVGRVAGAEKAYLLRNAMAVVMPSRGWEAFPLVVLEAYAAGRPVVASAVAGLEDLVTPDTGLLVPPESPTEWAAAMRRVWEDQPWRESAGQAARAAAKGYEWDAIARRHVELYERLTGVVRQP